MSEQTDRESALAGIYVRIEWLLALLETRLKYMTSDSAGDLVAQLSQAIRDLSLAARALEGTAPAELRPDTEGETHGRNRNQ